MSIKFTNQVTKRLSALWNTSLQLSPREIEEGPVSLVTDIGNDLERTFQGSIYVSISLPVGATVYKRADVIAALHASVVTPGNAPARYVLDRDDVEYIQISNLNTNYRVVATPGEVYTVASGVSFTGINPTTSIGVLTEDAASLTIPAGGGTSRQTYSANTEFKKNVFTISSDQISSSVAGGIPMPEYLAPFVLLAPPGVMAAPVLFECWMTYRIKLVYKRPYQAIQNNSRSLTSY